MRQTPQAVHLPAKPRVVAEVDAELRKVIRSLAMGEAAWPLLLHGPPGTGKTCAGLVMLDHCAGWYYTAATLCERLIEAQKGLALTPDGKTMTPAFFWLAVRRSTLFVVDEIGGRKDVSEFHYETIKRVLDEREGRPLVVISNLTLKELEGIYDDRVSSRLAGGTVVFLNGQDRRLKGKRYGGQ